MKRKLDPSNFSKMCLWNVIYFHFFLHDKNYHLEVLQSYNVLWFEGFLDFAHRKSRKTQSSHAAQTAVPLLYSSCVSFRLSVCWVPSLGKCLWNSINRDYGCFCQSLQTFLRCFKKQNTKLSSLWSLRVIHFSTCTCTVYIIRHLFR